MDTGELLLETELRVGLGIWSIEHPRFGENWYHSGKFEGYVSFMAYFPEHEVIIVVLINQHNPDEVPLIESLLEVVIN